MRRAVAAVIAGLLLPGPLAAPAAAATCPKTSVASVESQVMCLQCGVPLNVAESAPSARQERDYIGTLVAQCRSADEIKRALVAQYGDRVLALPRARGFGLLAYLVPALVLVAAAAAATLAAARWRRRRPPAEPTVSSAPPSPEREAQLEADLGRYRG